MKNINKIALLTMFAMLPLIGCKNGTGKSSDVNAVKNCLSRINNDDAGLVFYSANLLKAYNRYQANQKLKNVRATDAWQDLTLKYSALDTENIIKAVADKTNIPFSEKIVSELLDGEMCGAVNWAANDDEFKETTLREAQVLIVKPLKNAVTAGIVKAAKEIVGDQKGAIALNGGYSMIADDNYLVIGHTSLVNNAKEMLQTPRDVQLSKLAETGNDEFFVEFDKEKFFAKTPKTAVPLLLEPFSKITCSLNKAADKNLYSVMLTPKAGFAADGKKFNLEKNIPESAHAVWAASGLNLSTIWNDLKTGRMAGTFNEEEVLGMNVGEKFLNQLDGQVLVFFDGFLDVHEGYEGMPDASMALVAGINKDANPEQLNATAQALFEKFFGESQEMRDINPAKFGRCASGLSSHDGRCYAIMDKAIVFGYERTVKRVLATAAGRVADLSDKKALANNINGKDNFYMMADANSLADDFKKLLKEKDAAVMTPFLKTIAELGFFEMNLRLAENNLQGEVSGL